MPSLGVRSPCFSYKFFFEALEVDLNHFGNKKWQFLTFFFKFHYMKSTFYNPKQLVNGLIYLLKKLTFLVIKLLIAVDSKFKNDASTSPSGKKKS
jgi:hypothetical protein